MLQAQSNGLFLSELHVQTNTVLTKPIKAYMKDKLKLHGRFVVREDWDLTALSKTWVVIYMYKNEIIKQTELFQKNIY